MRRHLPWMILAVAVVASVIVVARRGQAPSVAPSTSPRVTVVDTSTGASIPMTTLADAAGVPAAVAAPEEVPSSATLSVWFQELPRANNLPADVHFAPAGVARAGERFGAMYDAAKKTPAFRDSAARFFGACAEDTTVLDGIRALCLHNWREFRPSSAAVPVTDERIQRIADFLPKNPRG